MIKYKIEEVPDQQTRDLFQKAAMLLHAGDTTQVRRNKATRLAARKQSISTSKEAVESLILKEEKRQQQSKLFWCVCGKNFLQEIYLNTHKQKCKGVKDYRTLKVKIGDSAVILAKRCFNIEGDSFVTIPNRNSTLMLITQWHYKQQPTK